MKVHEQLHSPAERLVTTDHPSILRLERSLPDREDSERLETGLEELVLATTDRNEVRSRRVLFDMVAEGGEETQQDMGDIDAKRTGRSLAPSMAMEDEIPA